MKRYEKITPEGTKDCLFAECAAQMDVRERLTRVFESYAYAPVMTPHLEFQDLFLRPSAEWLAERLYHATDSAGHLLALRPDNTLPIARVAATRLREAELPLRLYTHQSVFRRSRSYSGRNDEIHQSGVELLGAQGLRADLEILLCAVDSLRACDCPRFRLELGHAGLFRALADELGPDEETRASLVRCIETKNYPALEALLAPCQGAAAAALRQLPRLFGGGEIFPKAKKLFRDTGAAGALEYLREVYAALEAMRLEDVIDIDLGLVHGQDYYTGLVFRGYMEGSGETLLSGGRYDGLLEEFGRPAAAVGFALRSEYLARALLASGAIPPTPAPDVLIYAPPGLEAVALLHMEQRRAQGLRCELGMMDAMEDARIYARTHGIMKIAVVAGEDMIEDVEVRHER